VFAVKSINSIKMFLKIGSRSTTAREWENTPDEELVNEFKKQANNHILGELFERYTYLIFGVCMKYLKDEEESKDAVMQIFEELPSKMARFEISNFKSWIYSVSKNHCLMQFRKEKTELKIKSEIYENLRSEIMESEELLHSSNEENKSKLIENLHKGIEMLKAEQRECVELLYLQNKSYKEVAEITGYDLKKVKSYIQNGKRNLKIYLENK
jgi:RNA polymerase sigma-70 factor (ECF subfamily)